MSEEKTWYEMQYVKPTSKLIKKGLRTSRSITQKQENRYIDTYLLSGTHSNVSISFLFEKLVDKKDALYYTNFYYSDFECKFYSDTNILEFIYTKEKM